MKIEASLYDFEFAKTRYSGISAMNPKNGEPKRYISFGIPRESSAADKKIQKTCKIRLIDLILTVYR